MTCLYGLPDTVCCEAKTLASSSPSLERATSRTRPRLSRKATASRTKPDDQRGRPIRFLFVNPKRAHARPLPFGASSFPTVPSLFYGLDGGGQTGHALRRYRWSFHLGSEHPSHAGRRVGDPSSLLTRPMADSLDGELGQVRALRGRPPVRRIGWIRFTQRTVVGQSRSLG